MLTLVAAYRFGGVLISLDFFCGVQIADSEDSGRVSKIEEINLSSILI